jgi:ankyrin repeat protein
LWWASLKGHTEVVRLLLGRGADVHAKATDGYTSLRRARENKHVEIIRLLEMAGAKE